MSTGASAPEAGLAGLGALPPCEELISCVRRGGSGQKGEEGRANAIHSQILQQGFSLPTETAVSVLTILFPDSIGFCFGQAGVLQLRA